MKIDNNYYKLGLNILALRKAFGKSQLEMANDLDKTYLINIFKEEKDLLNLYGLSDVKTMFNQDDLCNFAALIFGALQKYTHEIHRFGAQDTEETGRDPSPAARSC